MVSRNTYKLVKVIGSSEEIITKSHFPMYPKMHMETLRDEFIKLINDGCLKASIFIPEGQAGFRLTYAKGTQIINVWYDLRMETNYDIR